MKQELRFFVGLTIGVSLALGLWLAIVALVMAA